MHFPDPAPTIPPPSFLNFRSATEPIQIQVQCIGKSNFTVADLLIINLSKRADISAYKVQIADKQLSTTTKMTVTIDNKNVTLT